MKIPKTEVKKRLRALRASGRTKADVQRFAKVSERMVYLWYRGERTSSRVQAAHDALTLPPIERERIS